MSDPHDPVTMEHRTRAQQQAVLDERFSRGDITAAQWHSYPIEEIEENLRNQG